MTSMPSPFPQRSALRFIKTLVILAASLALACGGATNPGSDAQAGAETSEAQRVLDKYITVPVETELPLSDNQKQVIELLIEAAEIVDGLYWQQAYGEPSSLLEGLGDAERRAVIANFGPWDRLGGNEPFLDGVGPKPPGASFYPHDVTQGEVENAIAEAEAAGDAERVDALKSLYTFVERGDDGELVTVAYHDKFADELGRVADLLRRAADLTDDEPFASYLRLRAEALVTDEYYESDLAWMGMKDNVLELVIGPIENYEDQLFAYKTAYETFVLIKDTEWSARLSRYADVLPGLQKNLPVPEAYRRETPGSDSELNAYDVLYVSGDANAGSKTIAINLPNDERVQLERGTRRLQLRNAMRAKFDKILVPIAGELIDEAQRTHVTFDAFFTNTMFHEVAHGLGIKNTINDRGSVRQALKEKSSALEEGKADVLGLFMLTQLLERGELEGDVDLADHYVTFMASIFRSIRFGSSSAHGTANLIRFNYFAERGAFTRDPETGTYRVEMDGMGSAVDALAEKILTLQGDGDYEGALAFFDTYANVGDQLQADLDRLTGAGIPVDILYEQGPEVLGIR